MSIAHEVEETTEGTPAVEVNYGEPTVDAHHTQDVSLSY
jgi:hypothetical protein